MSKILSLFQDENGQLSMIRMLTLFFVLNYIVKDQGAFWTGSVGPDLQTLTMALGAIGFKLIQKPFEKKV